VLVGGAGVGAWLYLQRPDPGQVKWAQDQMLRARGMHIAPELIMQQLSQKVKKNVVETAAYNIQLKDAEPFIQRRLRQGATAQQIADELVKNGWAKADAGQAVKRATAPVKAQTARPAQSAQKRA
jgi:DNA-binding NarL/FixJ family response regulator